MRAPSGGSGRQWLILLMVQLANMLFGMTITLPPGAAADAR